MGLSARPGHLANLHSLLILHAFCLALPLQATCTTEEQQRRKASKDGAGVAGFGNEASVLCTALQAKPGGEGGGGLPTPLREKRQPASRVRGQQGGGMFCSGEGGILELDSEQGAGEKQQKGLRQGE